MSKINIFNAAWNNMVFEGRNKQYGAYQLRLENPKTTVKAFLIGAALFSFLIAMPIIYDAMGNLVANEDKEDVKVIEVIDIPPPVEDILPPPPPPVEVKQAPKSLIEEVKLKPLEAVKKEEVPDDPPKQEQFKDANPGSENKEASPTGDVNIGTPSGDLDKGVEPGPDNTIYTSAGLQVQPEFPGGINAFRGYVSKNFRIPEIDQDMQVKIYVSFVVERDGTMTDIKARDPGYGLGKEAERVIKAIKTKWSPGIQNGKAVRASYSLPIVINIKS
jgi:protein TonB